RVWIPLQYPTIISFDCLLFLFITYPSVHPKTLIIDLLLHSLVRRFVIIVGQGECCLVRRKLHVFYSRHSRVDSKIALASAIRFSLASHVGHPLHFVSYAKSS